MRTLLPTHAEQFDVDVHEHYAAQWLDRGGIRANMIASADGAAAADGLSGGLQTPADGLVFAALRDLADVVLVGWSTAAAENYGPARLPVETRRRWGMRPELPIAVITRSLQLDTGSRLFTDNRPLVVTCGTSSEQQRAELADRADVIVCGDDDIDYAAVRHALATRGLTRVLCEGGPTDPVAHPGGRRARRAVHHAVAAHRGPGRRSHRGRGRLDGRTATARAAQPARGGRRAVPAIYRWTSGATIVP